MLSSVSTSNNLRQAVVLIINRDPTVQRNVRERLANLGYSARSVDDYSSAMNVLASTPPDVVVIADGIAEGEDWNALQAELTKWGIPVVRLDGENPLTTSPLPGVAPTGQGAELKLKIDAALRTRSVQQALMTENARLAAERLNDPLTGLYNRRYMLIRIEEEIMRSSRGGHPLACMLMDIDKFDAVNEKWGHQVGDGLLRQVAHLAVRTLRGSDIVCRYRDDQFLMLLTDTDAEGAQIAANRVRDAIAEQKFANPLAVEPIQMTASLGVAYWQPAIKPGGGGTWEPQLLGLCERAVKAAKQSGTNRLVILQAS